MREAENLESQRRQSVKLFLLPMLNASMKDLSVLLKLKIDRIIPLVMIPRPKVTRSNFKEMWWLVVRAQ